MSSYDIGISGFNAAQRALDVIGNNIANAATEGYHRQELDLRSAKEVFMGGLPVGQGVKVEDIFRVVDKLLDTEIVNQESVYGQMSKELDVLKAIEGALGELSTEGLSTAMDNFYDSLHYLSTDPNDANLQHSVVTSAESLSHQFRMLGTFMKNVQNDIHMEATETVDKINLLASQIAQLNNEISSMGSAGANAINTLDYRDQLVTDLSRLIGVTTYSRDGNSIDISIGNMTLVSGSSTTEVELSLIDNGGSSLDIALAPVNGMTATTTISGGKLGALLNLRNTLVKDIKGELDSLASTIVTDMNVIQSQAVGSNGSFTSLTGWTMTDNLSDFSPPLGGTAAETVTVRVTHADDSVTTHTINIDASASTTDTMTAIAAQFDAISGLDSVVNSAGQLTITATDAGDPNCKFDFLPVSPATSSDSIGFLAAVGLNCFFSGSSSETIDVTSFINQSGGIGNIGTSATTSMADNTAVMNMAKHGDAASSVLGGYTPKGYYRQMATGVGSKISSTEMRSESTVSVLRSLSVQRDMASGVDMNDEASKMLLFERMFQGMAKYINTVTKTLDSVMGLVQ